MVGGEGGDGSNHHVIMMSKEGGKIIIFSQGFLEGTHGFLLKIKNNLREAIAGNN